MPLVVASRVNGWTNRAFFILFCYCQKEVLVSEKKIRKLYLTLENLRKLCDNINFSNVTL